MSRRSFFDNNALFIISSFSNGEMDTGKHLHDHFVVKAKIQNRRLEHFVVKSSEDLERLLGDIVIRVVTEQIKPILHFEMHGDMSRGLEIRPSGELYSWDRLITCLRPINRLSGGNLCVFLAACYGFYAIKPIQIMEASPMYVLVGPEGKVTAGDTHARFKSAYDHLWDTDNFLESVERLGSEYKMFHAESLFLNAVAGYFKQFCMGRGRRERVDRLVGTAIEETGKNDAESIKKMRSLAKEKIRPTEEAFHRLADCFIVGNGRYSIRYEDAMRRIRGRT